MPGKGKEQIELDRRQTHFFMSQRDHFTRYIDTESTGTEDRRILMVYPPQEVGYTKDQFPMVERFLDIVISTQFETGDDIVILVPLTENDHREGPLSLDEIP